MAITLTPNIGLVKVTVGTEAGTWGPYINQNQDTLDSLFGGEASIALAAADVTLSAAQAANNVIVLTGALAANINLFFPNKGKSYTIVNQCTNNVTFGISLLVTPGALNFISAIPNTVFDIVTGSGYTFHRSLPPIGTYWDFAGTAVPGWVSAESTPPFLLCNGGAFNAATYPVLAAYLGGNILPDFRGRIRANYNAGTGRITAAGSGIDGNTLTSAGGNELMQSHTHTGTTGGQSADHTHQQNAATQYNDANPSIQNAFGGNLNNNLHDTGGTSNDHTHSFTTDATGGGGSQNMPPVAIGGITLVRAG